MTTKLSDAVRNARLDAIESAIGLAPLLRFYDGSVPASCAASESGNNLCEITLPSDWMGAAAAGVKAKAGTWSGVGSAAAGAGTAATHYRIYESTGTTCHVQGTVTATGGGGDITIDNVSIALSQVVAVSSYSLTDANG